MIKNLKLLCRVGVKPEERKHLRVIFISVTLNYNMTKVCKTDRLEDTINYSELAKNIQRIVYTGEFFLIEKIAQVIADFCLSKYSVRSVTVEVKKPDSPANTEYAAVEICRKKK